MKLFYPETFLPALLLSSVVCAFSPSLILQRRPATSLFAADGAPQYDKQHGKLREAESVGEGSVMLHIDVDESSGVIDYKPGHVLALEIEDKGYATSEKAVEDTKKNGGWIRGPYTVTRATENSFDVLIRVVGEKSRALAGSKPGTPMKFGGKFHVPIYEGIQKDAVKRVLLLSTGVGIGPCVGAIEEMVIDNADFAAKVELVASFRNAEDIVYREYLNDLASKYPTKFSWKIVVTSEVGRISASEDSVKMATANDEFCSIEDTHYHLIGNGQLVNEWKAGLAKAGVPGEKVTIESYHNHRGEIDETAVENIAKVISATAKSPVM